MNYGDIVKVIGCESVPQSFLGCYGIVTEYITEQKVSVEFKGAVAGKGSLSHTAYISDLKKIK